MISKKAKVRIFKSNIGPTERTAIFWKQKEAGTTKRDAEKVRGARDEGSRVGLGPGRKAGSGQNTMAFLCVGLMCEQARRGLSK